MSKNQEDTNINTRQIYNRLSSDSVASDYKPGVELTKFSAKNDELDQQSIGALSAYELSKNNEDQDHSNNNGERFQFMAYQKRSNKLNDLTVVMPYLGKLSTVVGQENFVVVWERLSFVVDTSLHDKVINCFNRSLKGIWPLKRHKQEDDFETTTSNDNLRISVSMNSECSEKVNKMNAKRVIFENLNGFIKSGEISAILGPSGAGKTSLLNAICGKVDNYRGTVKLIGGGSRNMRLSIIPQKDYLIENLTVKENLLYSSKILNTNKEFDHKTHILSIVRMLNLTDCFESSVSNISGGEYKRVSIAQELLKQPDLLILDEPTSGLDSLNCKNLIKSLACLIDASRSGSINPIAIVMTIHQPDVEVFHMFDHVYCMARRGRVIYDGHPGDVLEVLNSQLKGLSNYDAAIDAQNFAVNPATLLIEIASETIYGQEVIEKLARYQKTKFELEMRGKDCRNQVLHEQLHKQLVEILNSETSSKQHNYSIDPDKSESSDTLSISVSSNSSNGQEKQQAAKLARDRRLNAKKDNHGKFWSHTNILARRTFKSTIRDSLVTVISFLFFLTIPFVMWMVYSEKIGSSKACPIIQRDLEMVSMISNKTIEKIVSLKEELNFSHECTIMLFLMTYSFSMCSIGVTSIAFPLNMHILLKEVRNGWYNLPSFVIAKTIANFPFEVLFPAMSLMLCYVLLDMPPSYMHWRFWAMALVMALISVISNTHGLIFGAIFMDSVETAIFMALSTTLPLVLLSGFTSRVKNMPKLLRHLSWLSPYRYSTNALNLIRFGHGICPCDDSTADYLNSEHPKLLDISENMRPLFSYYLTSNARDPQTTPETVETTIDSMIDNTNKNLTIFASTGVIKPFGVGSELNIDEIDRLELLSEIEANQIDPFKRLANLITKSFTFGREITTCDTVRPEILADLETPTDDYLPYLFLGMILLLIVFKILLFVIVKYRIGKRV